MEKTQSALVICFVACVLVFSSCSNQKPLSNEQSSQEVTSPDSFPSDNSVTPAAPQAASVYVAAGTSPSPTPTGTPPPAPGCSLTLVENKFPEVKIKMTLSGTVSSASIDSVAQTLPEAPANTILYHWTASSPNAITLQAGVVGPSGQSSCSIQFGPPCPANTVPLFHYVQNKYSSDPVNYNHWDAYLEEISPASVISYDVGITNLGVFACLPTSASGGALQTLTILWQPFGDGVYQNQTGYSINANEIHALAVAYGISTATKYLTHSTQASGTVPLYRCEGTYSRGYLSFDSNCANIPGPVSYKPQTGIAGSALLGYVYPHL